MHVCRRRTAEVLLATTRPSFRIYVLCNIFYRGSIYWNRAVAVFFFFCALTYYVCTYSTNIYIKYRMAGNSFKFFLNLSRQRSPKYHTQRVSQTEGTQPVYEITEILVISGHLWKSLVIFGNQEKFLMIRSQNEMKPLT